METDFNLKIDTSLYFLRYDYCMKRKLFLLKLAHTAVFWFMSGCLVYILFCGLTGTYNWALLGAISAILLEGVALLLNGWRCPMRTYIERVSGTRGAVSDMFVPRWLSENLFKYSAVLFIGEMVLLGVRWWG